VLVAAWMLAAWCLSARSEAKKIAHGQLNKVESRNQIVAIGPVSVLRGGTVGRLNQFAAERDFR
jgi:hypothetical protein